MAVVDQFLHAHVQSGLEPGESVMGAGMLRRPVKFNGFGIPQKYDDYLAVATDRRLIVFETETGFAIMTPTAKPVAHSPIVWRYDELQIVRTASVEGVIVHSGGAGTYIALVPHAYCGPLSAEQDPDDLTHGKARRYDIYAQIDGIDGQRQLHAQFPQWLSQRVGAGAFPLPPHRRAEVEARIAQRRAAMAAEQERRRIAAAERDAKIRAAWAAFRPYIGHTAGIVAGVVALLVGVVLLLQGPDDLFKGLDRQTRLEPEVEMLQKDIKTWVRDPKLVPPDTCPEKKWERPDELDARHYKESPTCHLCRVTDRPPNGSLPGARVLTRAGKTWECPPPAAYDDRLSSAELHLDDAVEDLVEGIVQTIGGVIGVLGGIAGIVVAAALLKRKRKAVGSAGAGLAGAAAPQPPAGPPMLGAPGAPG